MSPAMGICVSSHPQGQMLTQDDERVDWGGGECSRMEQAWVSGPDPSGLVDSMRNGEMRERLRLIMLT